MFVPGLMGGMLGSEGIIVRLSATQNNPDVFVSAGSPSYAGSFLILVDSGVTIGSSDRANPSLDLTPFLDGSVISLYNYGDIRGAGGDGGGGAGFSGSGNGRSGFGGGGAGTVAGSGAVVAGYYADTGSDDGTATTGGAGGIEVAGGSTSTFDKLYPPEDGGSAIECGNITLTVLNNGTIWGGGGGGGGGGIWAPIGDSDNDGGAGGTPGAAGIQGGDASNGLYLGDPGGAGGYAIKHGASATVTFSSGGSSPDVEGTVGT